MGRLDQTQSPRMGQPNQTPSPRMNNNFNPMFHAEPPPEPPVYEKQMVQTEQKYPNNGGMVNQQNQVPMATNQVPMATPGQPLNQQNQVPMATPGQPLNQQNQVPMARPGQPQYIPNNVTVNPPCGVHPQPSNWTSGLFDCMNDGENALITFFLPCVTFGQIAEIIDEGATTCGTSGMLYGLISCLFGIPCVYSCTFRAKLRNKFGLPDAPAPDWITHFFCEYCALCQEYRELKNRGLDPAIGWMGNVQKQKMGQQQEMMAPPMGQRMMG